MMEDILSPNVCKLFKLNYFWQLHLELLQQYCNNDMYLITSNP